MMLSYVFNLTDFVTSLARSPVYSHINNTLTGLSTLRSFGAEKMFIEQFYRLLNSHSSMYFLIITSARGFGVMMDAVCVIYISIITIIAMTSKGGLKADSFLFYAFMVFVSFRNCQLCRFGFVVLVDTYRNGSMGCEMFC